MSMATEMSVSQQAQLATVDPNKPTLADATPEWRQVLREAEKLAAASLTPVHLKVLPSDLKNVPEENRRRAAWEQTIANCLLVANQARRWNADIFAVAAETYVVGNKLGYQGKLIAAIVNARGDLAEPLHVLYSTGKADAFAAVVYGKRDGEIPKEAFPLLEAYADREDRDALRKLAPLGVLAIRVSVGQARTRNEVWNKDPEQKLWYTGATKWARRHAPELMLGVLSNDDLDRMREEETHAGHEVAQSRISMVIPASLDASGTLPAPQITSDVDAVEPDADAEPESQPQVESEPAPSDESVTIAQWKDDLASVNSLAELAESKKIIPKLSPEGQQAIITAIEMREAAIRGSRGQNSNQKSMLPSATV